MKQLTISDRNLIESFLKSTDYEGYNYNFNSMMMWNHIYHIRYEACEHFLVLLYQYEGRFFWMMPLCSPEYYQQAIERMQEISEQEGIPFVISYVEESFKTWLEEQYEGRFSFSCSPDYSEYIYSCERNRTLAGRKMVKRRNHFNAFLREHPDYEYRDLSQENLDEVRACLARWECTKETDDTEEDLRSEHRGIMDILKNFSRLDLKGGCIYIDGQMEAFIIGSALGDAGVEIHIEKANAQIRGLYVAVLKEFLSHHFPDAEWINREEDMGYENLRKAKQQLHPIRMIDNYNCTEIQTDKNAGKCSCRAVAS
ncbi:MAG: phosphatidylglycerol lysyltransferase domain-containing protein [Lachnospiraceae bacterium]|nr:phosphatidylglycerol lysyltransferase domain-containing protein [Lachnospiraceae bacterium]